MYLNFSLHDQDTHFAELIYLRIAVVALARQHFWTLSDDNFDFPPAESAN